MENPQIQGLEVLPPPSQRYVAMAEERSLNFLNPKLWSAMKVVAETFMQAGALPASIKNAQQLLMVLQAGYEAGLQPLEAIKSFYFVNGGLALYGEMAITMVIRAGHKVEWLDCSAMSATCRITRKDGTATMANTFTTEMARARGINNPVLSKYPENFLKFKAFHMTAKFVCPDAFHGVDIGEVQDEERSAVASRIVTASEKPAEPASTHKSLDQALSEPEEPKEEKKPRKLKGEITNAKVFEKPMTEEQFKKEYKAEPEAVIVDNETTEGGSPVVEETSQIVEKRVDEMDDETVQRLVDEELAGRKLTPKELMAMNAYKAKKQAQASQ